MANFKAGQRFRYVASGGDKAGENFVPIGAIGEVQAAFDHPSYGPGYTVRFDKYPARHVSGCFFLESNQMAPLTDPLAAAFIENMERFAREPQHINEPATP